MSTTGSKDGPIRTCMSCRLKRPQRELLRFALVQGELLTEDTGRRLGGRGIYCCNEESCLRRFVKNSRRSARALRKDKVRLDDQLKGLFGSKE